jgi:hypothetical protein
LPVNGDIAALADGPFGMLLVGAKRNKARAIYLGLDGQFTPFAAGVNDKPALTTAVCGAAQREAWGAATGILLRFEKGTAVVEKCDATDAPAAMALDVIGVPWLVTERAVLRRHVEGHEGVWKAYHKRDANKAPFVGIGFTPDGVTVLDARGGGVELEPHDIGAWRQRASQLP